MTLPSYAATHRDLGHAGPKAPALDEEKRVTLDVRDEDARDVFASLQRQCGIRNVVIDPRVQVRGTFFFHDLPCSEAFRAAVDSMGLVASRYDTNLTIVRIVNR